ncbi:MAG: alcohol dehydrogenase [Planctomycetota bacterium]|nr:MAG: alcohol dehydrogenase [Planctomycetota bacterium]
MIRSLSLVGWIGLWMNLARPLVAGDWPQILGPTRSGVAASDERIATQWGGVLPTVWSRRVGAGYAGIVVSEGRAVLFHRLNEEEVVECLEAATGKPLWRAAHPITFQPQVGNDNGPRATPAIAGNKVVTYGAAGALTCYELATGRELWRKSTHKDFQATEGYFGAGSSPLILGDRVIVNVGGKKQAAGVVAFSLTSGETLWQRVADDASYSSPVVMTSNEQTIAIVITRLKCVGLMVEDGTEVFNVPFGARGPTVNGAAPVVLGDRIFLTSSYGVGSLSGQLTFPTFQTDYSSGEFFASQYATPVPYEGMLLGLDGRDDIPPADLKCIDPVKKRVLWSEQSFGYGTQILVDGKLVLLKTNGELVLVQPDLTAYDERGRVTVLSGETRALPALSNGLLYVRDDQELKCVDLRAPRKAAR